jgi:Tol biopolymer transport system component
VAIWSSADNLVPDDSNGIGDVFVKDLQTGAVTLVSADASGNQGNAESEEPNISADGRYVAFMSVADNLVPGDVNGSRDVFVKDLQTGAITLVSADASGIQGNNVSEGSSISADGRYVAFVSDADNLVAGDSNGVADLFVKDLQTGAITRMSTDASGSEGNAFSHDAAISADGRYVTFFSEADNLVPGDTNGVADVFVAPSPFAVPKITSNGGGNSAAVSVAENGTAVTTVTAFDPNALQLLSYSILGGDDSALFTIDATTGALAFASAPDFENPTDAGANNVYDVTVQVSDGNGGTATQSISVDVTDVAEGAGIDGYIAGATVFSDADDDGVLDVGEANTTTNANGIFVLFDGTGALVLTGGTDVATGRPFTELLRAPAGASTITPLTT